MQKGTVEKTGNALTGIKQSQRELLEKIIQHAVANKGRNINWLQVEYMAKTAIKGPEEMKRLRRELGEIVDEAATGFLAGLNGFASPAASRAIKAGRSADKDICRAGESTAVKCLPARPDAGRGCGMPHELTAMANVPLQTGDQSEMSVARKGKTGSAAVLLNFYRERTMKKLKKTIDGGATAAAVGGSVGNVNDSIVNVPVQEAPLDPEEKAQRARLENSMFGKQYVHQRHWVCCAEDGEMYLPISKMLKCLGSGEMPDKICRFGIMKVELYRGHTLLVPAKIPGTTGLCRLLWLSATGVQSGCLREAVPEYCVSEKGLDVIMHMYCRLAIINLLQEGEDRLRICADVIEHSKHENS